MLFVVELEKGILYVGGPPVVVSRSKSIHYNGSDVRQT